jgi:hypothetical protein
MYFVLTYILYCSNMFHITKDKAIDNFSGSSIALPQQQAKKAWSNPIMTYTIPNHHGYHFAKEATEWPVFDQKQEYCGQIWSIAAWAVPAGIHENLGLPDHIDLYLTSAGQWAPTLEQAEHYLVNTEAPTEFRVKGASLGLFVCGKWAIDNGSPDTYGDYRVFKCSAGYWDAEEIDQLPSPKVAEAVFAEILSAIGGYTLLQQALGIRASYLCRSVKGELIMHFESCNHCSKVSIELHKVNMYHLTFYRFSLASVDRGCQIVAVFGDISRDLLQQTFEDFTGLSLVPQLAST